MQLTGVQGNPGANIQLRHGNTEATCLSLSQGAPREDQVRAARAGPVARHLGGRAAAWCRREDFVHVFLIVFVLLISVCEVCLLLMCIGLLRVVVRTVSCNALTGGHACCEHKGCNGHTLYINCNVLAAGHVCCETKGCNIHILYINCSALTAGHDHRGNTGCDGHRLIPRARTTTRARHYCTMREGGVSSQVR